MVHLAENIVLARQNRLLGGIRKPEVGTPVGDNVAPVHDPKPGGHLAVVAASTGGA